MLPTNQCPATVLEIRSEEGYHAGNVLPTRSPSTLSQATRVDQTCTEGQELAAENSAVSRDRSLMMIDLPATTPSPLSWHSKRVGRCRCCGIQWTWLRCGAVVLSAIFVLLGAVVLTFYLLTPYLLQRAMTESPMPTYHISRLTDTAFLVRTQQNLSTNSPFPMKIKPWRLMYGTRTRDFGSIAMPGFPIDAGSGVAITTDYTDWFNITDPQALGEFGHTLLQSVTQQQPTQMSFVAHGVLQLEAFRLFRWDVRVDRCSDFVVGRPSNQSFFTSSASNASMFHINRFYYRFPFSFALEVAVRDPITVAADLGTISFDLLIDDWPLSHVTLPNFQLILGQSIAMVDLRLASTSTLFTVLGEAMKLGIEPNATSIVRMQNIQLDAYGRKVSWVADWLAGITLNIPITKHSL